MSKFMKVLSCAALITMVSVSAWATPMPANWTASSPFCNYFTSGGNPDSYVSITVSSGGPIYTWTASPIAVSANTEYTFGLDYKAESASSWAVVYFLNLNGDWGVKYELMDQTLWGYPSLNPTSVWRNKTGSFITPSDCAFVKVELYNGYATTCFDNISLTTGSGPNLVANAGFEVPEPMTMSLLGLGALCLSRRIAKK